MAGSGPEGHCIYDHKTESWVPINIEPLPRADYEWECLDSKKRGVTEFILDSGSQLNLLPLEEVDTQGINVRNLPRIHLNGAGVSGRMKDVWYKFQAKVTSTKTNLSNFEELYLSEECKERLLSYSLFNLEATRSS